MGAVIDQFESDIMRRAGLHPFYPIVPDAVWAARVARAGARCLQLRVKDRSSAEISAEIAATLEACAPLDCQVIVNDHWREAMAEGADYIHLGQEDLASADIDALKADLVRIGISTHDDAELDRALKVEPDYVAIGPIFTTTSKSVTHAEQGLARISEWRDKIGVVPLVAIGGITLERAPSVVAAGADSIAVISDITSAANPEARIAAWLAWAESVD